MVIDGVLYDLLLINAKITHNGSTYSLVVLYQLPERDRDVQVNYHDNSTLNIPKLIILTADKAYTEVFKFIIEHVLVRGDADTLLGTAERYVISNDGFER